MLSYAELRDQRPSGESEDVHFTESLARAVVTEFSSPADTSWCWIRSLALAQRLMSRVG
jgi:hypothetical protein